MSTRLVPSSSVDLPTNLTKADSLITQLQDDNQETTSKLTTAQETYSKEIEQLSAQQHTIEDLKRGVKCIAAREEYYISKVAKLTEEKSEMLPGTATPSQTRTRLFARN